MRKAVLVLDEMPDMCTECQFSIYAGRYYCTAINRELEGYPFINKPDWCPLKALPEKKSEWEMDVIEFESHDLGEHVGWNKCVDYLLGEKEKENE